MDFRKLGSYEIRKKINKINYKLKLPIDRGRIIHPIFYISLLKKADQTIPEAVKKIVKEEQNKYKMEKILDQDYQKQYLIKWKGYSHSKNIWESFRNLTHYIQKFQEFL